MTYTRFVIPSVLAALIACAPHDEAVSTTSSNVETPADPFAGLVATKVADLPDKSQIGTYWYNYEYLGMRVVDANHVLLEVSQTSQSGRSLWLVDLTTGVRRELGTLRPWWGDVSISPDGKYIVAQDQDEQGTFYDPALFVAAVDGTGPAKNVGRGKVYGGVTPYAENRFAGDALIVSRDGVLSAYDLGAGTTRWSVPLNDTKDRVDFVVSADQKRVFAFSTKSAKIIDVADGHAVDAGGWPGRRMGNPDFDPSGRFVYGVFGDDPSAKLVRFPADGSAMEEVDTKIRSSRDYAFGFSPDGTKLIYRVIGGPAEWFDWPNNMIVRDLVTGERTVLGKDWLGGRHLPSHADGWFLSDGKTVWVQYTQFLFDSTDLTKGPVDVVPYSLWKSDYAPTVTLAPGETGFLITSLKEPGWFFRNMQTGKMRKLDFERGHVDRMEPANHGRTSAIVSANEDDLRGTWLISLTHQQKCMSVPYVFHFVNGSVVMHDPEAGLAIMTSDGLAKRPLPLPAATGHYRGGVTAVSGKSIIVERNHALYRIEVPDYTSPLPLDDGNPHPENACDQTPKPAAPSPPPGPSEDAGAEPPPVSDAGAPPAKPEPTPAPEPTPSPTKPSAEWPVKPATKEPTPSRPAPYTAPATRVQDPEDGGCSLSRGGSERGTAGAMLAALGLIAVRRRRARPEP